MKAVSCALVALTLGAVSPVLAQAPVPPAQLAKPAAPAGGGPRTVNMPGISPAGNAALTRLQAKPDPVLQQLAGQLQNVTSQLALTLQAPTLDVDKFAALLKQREGVQAQLNSHTDDRVIGALRVLPPADRTTFLKVLSGAGRQAPAGR